MLLDDSQPIRDIIDLKIRGIRNIDDREREERK